MKSLRSKLFPELTRFSTADERRQAWKNAQAKLIRKPLYWSAGLFIIVADLVFVFSLPALGIPMTERGIWRGIALLVVILCGSLLGFLFH